jgi:hypothetical protein
LIAAGSTPERSTAAFITVPASSAGSMSASAPPNVPIAERAAPSTTTSRLLISGSFAVAADSLPARNLHSTPF